MKPIDKKDMPKLIALIGLSGHVIFIFITLNER